MQALCMQLRCRLTTGVGAQGVLQVFRTLPGACTGS